MDLHTELPKLRQQLYDAFRNGPRLTVAGATETALNTVTPLLERCRDELGRVEAELERLRTERAEAHPMRAAYLDEANAAQEFFAELLDLLPGAQDTGSDAYDQIPRAIRALRAERDALTADRDGFKTALARTAQQLGRSEAAIDRVRRTAQVWVDIRPAHLTVNREGHAVAYAGEQILAALDTPTPTPTEETP